MPLTPEQQERIAQEERERVEEELFRARVRDTYIQELTRKHHETRRPPRAKRRMPRVPGLTTRSPLTWVYIGCLLLLSFVVARQFGWLRRASHDPIQVARNEEALQAQPAEPAVFGERRELPKQLPPDNVPEGRAPVTVVNHVIEKPAQKPAPASPAVQQEQNTATRNRTSGPVPEDIQNVLRRWTDSVAAGDAETQAGLYGPTAEVYFTKHNVPHSLIESDKRNMLKTYPKVNRYAISNVKLESMQGDRAVVSLIKDWDVAGAHRFAGSEREQLTFARIKGEWKIIGEKETRVFWRKKE